MQYDKGLSRLNFPHKVVVSAVWQPRLNATERWMSLAANGWTIVTSELGYIAKNFPELTDEQRVQAGEFLQTLEDHDDVHRVWAALK